MAPANHQPKVAEHDVFTRSPLPDGHGKGCGCATSPRRLVRHDRLEGRVLPRPRQSPLPPLPSPRLEEEVLRVSRSPIRPYLAPFVFTFVTKPLQAFLHARGIRTIFYLDDLLIIGSSQKECFAFLKIALQLLSRVGFVVDHKKSCLLPQQKFRFLVFDRNTFSSLLSINNTRRRSITARASKMILSASPRARDLQILLGRLTSVVPTIPLLRLHSRFIQMDFNTIYRSEKDSYRRVPLSAEALRDLRWLASLESHQCAAQFTPLLSEDCSVEVPRQLATTPSGARSRISSVPEEFSFFPLI